MARFVQWHCSPSAVMQRALAQVTTSTPSQNSSPPDTLRIQAGSPADALQIREIIREELAAREAEQVSVTDTVTEAVTDTLARDLPGLVRELVEGLALEAIGLPVTDTNSSVADTDLPGEVPPHTAPQPPLGAMRQRILTLLEEHPEGLSAEAIRVSLRPEKPPGRYAPGDAAAREGAHTRARERPAVCCGLGAGACDS